MLKNTILTLVGIGLLICAVFAFQQVGGAPRAVPDTAETAAIQGVILQAYQLEADVAHSFDLAALQTVYVNDVRGEAVWEEWAKLVRDEWKTSNDPRLNDPGYTIGYLDYKQAYFGWWKRGISQREQLQARANQEQRPLTTDESQSLIDAAGRIPPARGEANAQPASVAFQSININGDIATAVLNDGPRTMEYTLVKLHDTWFIAGARILKIHV